MVHTYTGQHEIGGELCDPDLHCHSCRRDEDGPAYIACPECGHLYRTARDLRRAYRREWTRMLRREWPDAVWRRTHPIEDTYAELTWGWLRSRLRRARAIMFCQECLHDF